MYKTSKPEYLCQFSKKEVIMQQKVAGQYEEIILHTNTST